MANKTIRKFAKPKEDRPRSIAFEIFTKVLRQDGYSNLLLSRKLNDANLDGRDKAFITELVYGSLRQIGRNDYIAAKFSSKSWSEVDPGIVDTVRLGAYQLFDMRIPNHAAVSATVELARSVLGESKASYVNAIMRRLSEKSLTEHLSELTGTSTQTLAIIYSHPEWIIESYRQLINDDDELEALLRCNNEAVPPTLVSWPGKSTQNDLIELGCTPTKYSKFGGVFQGIPNSLDLIRERKAGVQDEGSQLVASIFAQAARDHEPWLDLCAGPGGKAALLSFFSKGPLTANEISIPRANLVEQVVRDDAKVLVGDGRDIQETLKRYGINLTFGAVLADVPCTGLGALRRRPEVRWRRKPEDLPGLTKLQFELAKSAIENLPTNGVFGYATCSPHVSETLAQAKAIERKLPVEKVDIAHFLPPGLSDGYLDGYLQLWPHRHQTDAMFLALYRKR